MWISFVIAVPVVSGRAFCLIMTCFWKNVQWLSPVDKHQSIWNLLILTKHCLWYVVIFRLDLLLLLLSLLLVYFFLCTQTNCCWTTVSETLHVIITVISSLTWRFIPSAGEPSLIEDFQKKGGNIPVDGSRIRGCVAWIVFDIQIQQSFCII